MDECHSNHDTCREAQQQEWMPTRLVDISDYEKGYARVVDSSTLPKGSGEVYLALSHCWGRKPFPVMSHANKEAFERGVLISSLGLNFQDAMFITRQIGFRYIWIDSLCIIQGSAKDWNNEAPLMNKVYKNAFLTLGALASQDGHGGLFRDRDPEMTNPCPFRLRTEDEGDIEGFLVNSDFWESQVRRAPLSQRAWVVQERILAPKSLYFGESQLFWECRQQLACELFPDGVPLEFITDIKEPQAVDVVSVKAFETTIRRLIKAGCDDNDFDKHHSGKDISDEAHSDETDFDKTDFDETDFDETGSGENGSDDDSTPWLPRQYESPYQVWNDILESYVKCALTKPEDKLVAISGVVKECANIMDDEYLAGIWRKNLINGLLWVAKDELYPGPSPPVRSAVYRAPSWSWASLDAPGTYTQELNLYGDYAQVLDVHVAPLGNDPTGQLTHACLHLRGHLVKTRRKPTYDIMVPSFGKFIADTEELMGDEFYCLPLREWKFHGEPDLRGLVLAPCPEENKTVGPSCNKCFGMKRFIRVGTFQINEGDPLMYLGMRRPNDWETWGEEDDHLWFGQDTSTSDFVII